MICPYCAEQIKDEAIVCEHCQRDLSAIHPLMEKLADVTRRLEILEAARPAGNTRAAAAAWPAIAPADSSRLPGIEPLTAAVLTFMALIAAHYLIIVAYSLPLPFLRVASIAAPLMLGFLCREIRPRTMLPEFILAVVTAAVSILVMSFIITKINPRETLLPRTAVQWREIIEYGASITFGFFTGVVLRQTLIVMNSPQAKPNWLISAAARNITYKLGGRAAGFNVRTIYVFVSTGIMLLSGIASVVTGLSHVF